MNRFTEQVLTTERLVLRPFAERDVPAVRAACDDATTQRWLPLPRPYTEAHARWWCTEGAPASLTGGDGIQFAAEDARTGELVGCFGLKSTNWTELTTEIGYWTVPGARGRGFAPEAVRAVARWALTETPVRRITLLAATGNTASQRVALKSGFTREGVLRGAGTTHDGRVDHVVFGLIPGDLPAPAADEPPAAEVPVVGEGVRDRVRALLTAAATAPEGARTALISAHEHTGAELIFHSEESQHTYRQSVEELMELLTSLGRDLLPEPPSVVGALVLPMPYYRRFKPEGTPVDPDTCGRVIRHRNLELLDDCARFRKDNPPAAGLPMTALMADPFRDADDFAADYEGRLDEVFALKWHPPAAETPISEYVARGYLDLAARWDVPTVLHCSPEGRLGDLAEIREHAVPAAVRAGARISLAHLGFNNPGLVDVLEQPGVHADLGPWEAVCERTVGDPGPIDSDMRLAALIAECGPRLMFSLDTPWHLQPWDDGRVLGAGTSEAVRRILGSLGLSGADARALLAGNALRYLFGAA
ncbi:GNAT family N-acetyltransferase [Streptomyces sp. NPDC048606]|uniref:GNAT family N-acetyltransferase n=1 Tax=Streptomyces sp. NPDC048606 TaxID=3154726 RepID=UPI00342BA8D7